MSQTVDNRVVELQFDNKQFEQGTKESLNTIQKLKDALKFEDAGKNLKELGNVTKNFDLNGIGNAVEQVGEKFSTMRLVGLMALSNLVDGAMQAGKKLLSALVAPLNQIKSGGWSRAMNIEDAKFQLKGLGVAWEEVADDIDHAVSGTAFGLDAAAKAASQLTASGVQAGDAMKKALRGISGIAAMANTSYEEISPIFTTIAGQGKVMTMQLRQLESRGINAAATLRDAFNEVATGDSKASESFQKSVKSITKGAQVTEETIRDMVTKGKINFDMFAEAMDNAFGEHAKEANDTFQGAFNNIKAALSRIGQNFATPIIHNMIPIFNTIRQSVNALNLFLDQLGLYKFFDKVASSISKLTDGALSKFIKEVTIDGKKKTVFSDDVAKNFWIFADAIKLGFTNILKILVSVKNAWNKVFNGSASENIQKIATGVLKLTKALTPTKAALHGLENIFTVLFTVFKKLGTVIGTVISKVGVPLVTAFGKIINIGLGLVGIIIDIVSAIAKLIVNSNAVKTIISTLSTIFTNFKSKLSDLSSIIGKVTTILATGFQLVATIVAGVLYVAINSIITLFNKLRSMDFSKFLNGLNNIKTFVVDLLIYIKELPIVKTIIEGITNAFLVLVGVIVKVGEGFVNLVRGIASGRITFNDFIESLKNMINKLGDLKAKFTNFLSTNPVIAKFVELFNKFKTSFNDFVKNTSAKIKEIDAVRLVLLAFAVGITAMVYRITGAIGSFSKLLKTGSNAIQTFIDSIAPKKSSFFTTFAGNLLKIAASIAVVAMSIKMLAEIPAENLERVTKSLLILAGGAAVLALLATVLGSILKVGKDGFSAFSANMLMFSAGVGILASSLLILDHVNMEGVWKKVAILGAIATALTVISIVMSKFAPKLTTGSLFMIAFAASVAILVKALRNLEGFDLSNLKGYWKELGAIFIGLAALAVGVSKIGIGPVLGLLAFVAALRLVFSNIDKLQEEIGNIPAKLNNLVSSIKSALSDIGNRIQEAFNGLLEKVNAIKVPDIVKKIVLYALLIAGAIGVLFTVFRTMKALSGLGEGLKNFSISIALIGATVVGLIWVSKYVAKWIEETPNMGKTLLIIGGFIGLLTALTALSGLANEDALKEVRKLCTSLTFVILSMTAFIAVAGKLKKDEWIRATVALELALGTIGGFAVWIASINAKAAGTKAGVTAFLGIVALFGVMLGSLAVLMTQLRNEEDYVALAVSLGAIGTLVVLLDSILERLATIRVGTGWKPILALFGALSIVAATMAGIALLLKNQSWKEVASKVGVITIAVAALTTMAMAIDALIRRKEFNVTKTSVANLKQLGLVVAALVGVMMTLTVMSAILKNVNILDMSGKLLVLLTVSGLLAVVAQKLSEINIVGGNIKSVITILIALGAVFAELAIIGYALRNIKADQLLFSLSSIAMVILELTVIFGIITKLVQDPKVIGYAALTISVLALMTAIFGAIAVLGIMLSSIDSATILKNLSIISLVILELGAVLGLMAALITITTVPTAGLNIAGIGIAVLALTAMTIIFSIIADIAIQLKGIDTNSMLDNLSALNKVILTMGIILAILGALSPFIGLGTIVIGGIIEICQAMLILSAALKNLRGMSAEGIASTMGELANGIGKIVKVGAGASLVSGGLIILADAVVKMGVACIQAGTGLTLFAQAMVILEQLRDKLPAISSAIETFFSTLNSGMATQFSQVAATVSTSISILTRNIIIGLQSGLQSAAGVAYQGSTAIGLNIVNGFNAGTGMTSGNGGFLSKFSTDFRNGMSRISGDLKTTTHKAWYDVGKQTEMGFRDGAQWHSEPHWMPSFGADVGMGFSNIGLQLSSLVGPLFQNVGLTATFGIMNGLSGMVPGVEDTINQMTDLMSGTMGFNMDIDASGWFSQLTGIESETANRVARIKSYLGEIEAAKFEAEMGLYDVQIRKTKDLIETEKAEMKTAERAYSTHKIDWETRTTLVDNHTKKLKEQEDELVRLKDKRFLYESEYDKKIKEVTDSTNQATEATNNYSEALGGAGKAAKQSADDLQKFQESLKSTLEGQMDVFSEFKQSEKHTKEELFKNIQSQINGMASWAVNMDKLSERGIDQGLYQKLAEMGPQGAGYMEAFLDMTQEELAKYNDLWATSLVLPDATSQMLTASLQKAGENSMLGLYNGVKGGHQQVVDEFTNVATESVETVENEWDTHSPSVVFHEKGKDAMEGLRLGLMHGQGNVFARITFICQHIVALADTGLQPGKFAEFGGNIIQGLISGIDSNAEALWTKVGEICKQIEEKIHNSTLKFGSPSKTMMKYGGWIDEGLAIGIDKKAYTVYDSINNLADSALDTMKLTVANIAAQVNDSFEDPVITPVLDLSNVKAGVRDLNSIFDSNQAAVRAGSFSSNQNGQEIGSNNMIFNQYNTSPKALSRIEIYRDTRNLFAQAKGALS